MQNSVKNSERGFTLVELLIAMAIAMVVLTSISSAFIMQRKTYDVQEQIAEMTQNARAAMDMISREAKMAGYDPTGSGSFSLPYNSLTSTIDIYADADGDGIVTTTTGSKDHITYSKATGEEIITRNTNTGGGAQPFAENIQSFSIAYYDAGGVATTTTANVRQIKITITAQTSKPDPNYGQNSGYRRYTLTSRITPPNLDFYTGGFSIMKLSLNTKTGLAAVRSAFNNENGAALVIGLMFVAILGLLGSTAVVLTTTDMKIGTNYKTVTQAFNVAEAGTEEARARLSISKTADDYAGDPAASPDEWWSAYILTSTSFVPSNEDSNYKNYIPTAAAHTNTTSTVNSLQTDISYAVKIRHKREFDAEQAGHTVGAPHYYDNDLDTNTNDATDPGNIIYYGYGDPTDNTKICQFTIGTGTGLGTPVEIITGHGKAGGSFKAIQTEVIKALPPPILATLYGKDTTTINGSSGSFSGIDECGVAAPIDPVYVHNPDAPTDPGPPPIYSPSNIVETSPPTYAGAGSPPTAQEGGIDIDITGYVDSMKDTATVIITSDQNSGGYGGVDDYVTCYCNSTLFHPPGLDMRNLTGYGVLLVEGDLTLSGGFTWYGLVIVTGTLTLNGGGAGINIRGAAMGNQTVDINGGLDLRYDSCEIANAMLGQGLKIITWADILN